MRFVDATANMYLALAAILSAGLLGCVKNEPLLLLDTRLGLKAATSDGVHLPRSLGEALDRLAECHVELETMMQSKAIQNYLRLKRLEAAKLQGMGDKKTRLLFAELF